MNSKSENIVINFESVSKTFYINTNPVDSIREKFFNIFSNSNLKTIHALKNASFNISKGDFVGIIGHNGSGKSTLLKLIIGSIQPDKGGKIETTGKIIRLALGMGFDPNLTARDNIYVNGSIMGLSFKEIGKRFDKILTFAGLTNFVDTPIKFYSSGMVSRLAFSISMHIESEVLLIDEFFGGVGDIDFQEKSHKAFTESIIKNKTVLFVSHNLELIQTYCNKVIIFHQGELIFYGNPKESIELYKKLKA